MGLRAKEARAKETKAAAWPDLNYVGLRPACVSMPWAHEGDQGTDTLKVGRQRPLALRATFQKLPAGGYH